MNNNSSFKLLRYKKALSLLGIFCLGWMLFVYAQPNEDSRGYKVKVGDKAPDFEAVLNTGDSFKLSEQKGKLVMLQFTASWCGVCRQEMPYIEKEIWQTLKNKNIVVIGVDRDEPIETVNAFVEQTGISYPMALDPDAVIFNKFALKDAGVTRNVIIDADGKIIYLTRLFNRQEFDAMKNVIFNAVE